MSLLLGRRQLLWQSAVQVVCKPILGVVALWLGSVTAASLLTRAVALAMPTCKHVKELHPVLKIDQKRVARPQSCRALDALQLRLRHTQANRQPQGASGSLVTEEWIAADRAAHPYVASQQQTAQGRHARESVAGHEP